MLQGMISVIVPIYNCESYLKECVDSILQQSYENLEIILVDDGSTDQSGRICDFYRKRDKRIRTIHKANGGQQDARSAGIEAAQGEYIGFVDGDDWIEKEMYEKLFAAIDDGDLSTSGIFRHDQVGAVKEVWKDSLPEGVYDGEEKLRFLLDNLFIDRNYSQGRVIGGIANNLVCKLFRTSIVKEICQKANVFLKYEEDALFCFLYVLRCRKITISHMSYYHYRDNPASVTNNAGEEFWERRNKYYVTLSKALKGHWLEDCLRIQLQKRFLYGTLSRAYSELNIPIYTYTDEDELEGKRIVLFGAGSVGRSYYREMKANKNLEIVSWIDNVPPEEPVLGRRIEIPERLERRDFDCVLCAVKDEKTAEVIKKQLIAMGIRGEKILWRKPIIPYEEICLR